MFSSLPSTIRTVLAIRPLRLPKPPWLMAKRKSPPGANGQNLSKTLLPIRYGKANGDGKRGPDQPENRRKPRDSSTLVDVVRPRAAGRLSRRHRYRPGDD